MFSTYIGIGLVLFFVFRIVGALVRRGVVQPNTPSPGDRSTSPVMMHVNPNPELNMFNTSPLAILQRWQSGIQFKEFRAHNQNNPQGASK